MDIKATFEQIKGLNALIYQINKREKSALKVLYKLHRQIFGEDICADCSNGHIKGYNRLVRLTLAELTAMANKEFKLLKGRMVEYPFRSGTFYVSETMPDEIAREYLTKHPQMVRNFSQYPKEFKLK